MRIVNDKFIFPLFFLIDTSQSMGWPADNTDSSKTSATRIDAANQLLPPSSTSATPSRHCRAASAWS